MATLNPKQFIKQVFIDELGVISENHPYIAFMIMGIGIEFLGKCLDTGSNDWNNSTKRPGPIFELAIKNLNSLKKYEQYLGTYKLYDSLRCGLAHSASPKYKITLSSKNEMPHLVESSDVHGMRLNLRCEDFYADFKAACEEIISTEFLVDDKMNENFLMIPDINTDDDVTGIAFVTPRF